jgi:glycine/D-amino acid oxidase-like deaminating enzyme
VKEYPYWWDTVSNPESQPSPPESTSELTADRPFDVAIIGAGYTGLAAARHLARVGASVVVLDRERAGWGASSRNGGQVLTGTKLDPATLVARFGEERARRLFSISLESIAALERVIADEAIACDYARTGHLQAAWKPSHFRAFRDEQALLARVFQHRVEIVARAEQRSELGSETYHGLMVDEQSAAINPAKYVGGLAAAACRAGALVLPHRPVTRVSRSSSRWKLVTGGGDIDAGDVLVATNGYTNGSTPALRRRLIPIGSYIIATEALPAADAAALLPRRRMVFDSKHFLYYFRLSTDNRLLFGGRAEFGTPTPETTKQASAILRRGLVRVFPQLASVRVEYAWGGNVAFTRDQMPRAGRLDGAYFAGGYCGHGIAMATYLGTLVARRIAGEPVDDHPLFDDRFAAIPLYRGHPWFLPLVGAYYRLRDYFD